MALICLISKKATLLVQHTFFVHFFAVVLQRLQRESSRNFLVTLFWWKCRTCSRSLFFFTAAHFHLALVAASIPYFLTATTKFSCCASNKKNVSFVVYLSFYISAALFLVDSLTCRLLSLFLCLSLADSGRLVYGHVITKFSGMDRFS